MTETKARAACLIGWPAAHSRSPLIHHHWLRTLGIEGGYVIEAVPPDELQDFVLRLSAHGFVGANITIPHKERALALSKPDARASAVGAANTLWYEAGELRSVEQVDESPGRGALQVAAWEPLYVLATRELPLR